MKARTYHSPKGVVVLVENEHKEAEVYIGNNMYEFPTYKAALKEAVRKIFNGRIPIDS